MSWFGSGYTVHVLCKVLNPCFILLIIQHWLCIENGSHISVVQVKMAEEGRLLQVQVVIETKMILSHLLVDLPFSYIYLYQDTAQFWAVGCGETKLKILVCREL